MNADYNAAKNIGTRYVREQAHKLRSSPKSGGGDAPGISCRAIEQWVMQGSVGFIPAQGRDVLLDEVAEYAAELRFKYYDYDPRARELSYADAIHLVTAILHDDCHTLYSGDPDFEGLEEIETAVL